jgi:hypothetical protein
MEKEKDITTDGSASASGSQTDFIRNSSHQHNGHNSCHHCRMKHVEWSPENELILAEWCDIAQCYKWLYMQSHASFAFQNGWFTIPAIILSTITGTASFAQNSFTPEQQTFSPMVIGTVNIIIGILTTVQQYLKISELKESHRASQIAWDKFGRNIRIELAKAPAERMDAGHFIKLSRRDYDHLMETSPPIPPYIVRRFHATFKGEEGSKKREVYDRLKKPDICDSIAIAADERHPWYTDPHKYLMEKNLAANDLMSANDPMSIEHTITNKEFEMKINSDKREQDAHRQKMTMRVDNFIHEFFTMYARSPTKIEIMDNFRGCDHPELLREYVEKYEMNVIV